MELKQIEPVAIKVNGTPILAYTVQSLNDAYRLPVSFGEYARRGHFTAVAHDGNTSKHYLPKDKFDVEIVKFAVPPKRHGKPSLESRIIHIEEMLGRIFSELCGTVQAPDRPAPLSPDAELAATVARQKGEEATA